MKKLMLIVPSLRKGGVERVVSILSKEFSKFYEVYVIIYHNPVEFEVDAKLINLETPTGNLGKKIRNIFYRVVKIKQLERKISPDFIISFMGNLQPILTFKPVIVSIHNNPDIFPLYRKILLKTIYKLPNVKKIVTVSTGIEKKVNSSYNLENTKTIYNPLNLDYIAKELISPKPFEFDYILTIGRLCRQKAFDILINAFAKSDLKNRIKLVILGEGGERNTLEKLIVRLNLENQVLLFGKVNNPFIYMKFAKFFLLSSRYEGFPVVLLEALACGTPVIATNCETGPSEIIENGKNGLLVPVTDEGALKAAMEKMFFDRELYKKIKANTRKSIKRFDVKNIVKEWISIFKEM